jgi:hypothetical protein
MTRARLVVLLVTGALGSTAACSGGTSGKPIGTGDLVIVDVEASTLPPQPSSDADLDPDGVFAPVDGSQRYGTTYDSYAALTVCAPPDGGASDSDGSEADEAGGAAATGCVPFPASCANASPPDCVCLFGAFAAQIPCTAGSCAVTKSGFSIYCP